MPLRGRDSHSPSLVSRAYAASTVAVLMCRWSASWRLEGMRAPGAIAPCRISCRSAA